MNNQEFSPPNPGIQPTKGSVHVAVNRHFVEYIFNNETGQEIVQWVKQTEIPDETLFSTLNHNPHLGIPGTYKGIPERTSMHGPKPFFARFKNWGDSGIPCARNHRRGICILSVGDLPVMNKRPELFANKFYITKDRLAVACLEERHFNRTRDDIMGVSSFDASLYGRLGFVIDQVKGNTGS